MLKSLSIKKLKLFSLIDWVWAHKTGQQSPKGNVRRCDVPLFLALIQQQKKIYLPNLKESEVTIFKTSTFHFLFIFFIKFLIFKRQGCKGWVRKAPCWSSCHTIQTLWKNLSTFLNYLEPSQQIVVTQSLILEINEQRHLLLSADISGQVVS